ncbi:MAG: DnaA ATPase domain-containing protein, partial [Planctomycetaceae bacterium]
MGARNFESLLKSRIECTYQGGRLRVEAAHPFVLQLLQSRFRGPLREAAEAVGCEPPEPRLSPRPAATPGATPSDGSRPTHPPAPPGTAAFSHALVPDATSGVGHPSAGLVSGNTPSASPATARDRTPSAPSATGAAGSHAQGSVAVSRRFGRLDDFVAGPHAAAALAATKAFTQSGPAGHALYLFGGTGTGKTHLLEGIVTELRRQPGGPQPLLLTAEQFTNLFTTALRSHELPSFRAKLRGVDVLLIDDVDFLDGKPRVQEEFLHTLQQLESTGRRFVLAADRHPRLLSRTRPELQTRFLSGVLCRVEQPDRDTREQIVVRKAGLLALRLIPESARLLAASSCTSVRELEGLLHTLRNLHRIPDQPVPVGLVRQVVAEIERDCVRVVRLPDIERVICETFGVSVEDLRSVRRTRTVAEPRMLAMYLARRHTRAAYAEIGAYFGG